MGRYVRWIEHKGVKMLFVNCNSLPEADVTAALVEAKQEILKGRSFPPTLIDLTKWAVSLRVARTALSADAALKAAGIPEGPWAMVGLMPAEKRRVELAQRERRQKGYLCDTVGQAKDWLARKAGEQP